VTYPIKLQISEAAFQQQIIDLARLTGHQVFHTYDSRRSEPGFPDLVIVKATLRRPIFAEIKTEWGKLSDHQELWKAILETIPGADYRLWRPSSWPQIENLLTGREW
jgi:hypothetical protein